MVLKNLKMSRRLLLDGGWLINLWLLRLLEAPNMCNGKLALPIASQKLHLGVPVFHTYYVLILLFSDVIYKDDYILYIE